MRPTLPVAKWMAHACLAVCLCSLSSPQWRLVRTCVAAEDSPLEWERLLELPAAMGEEKQLGVAGAFAGVHQNVLIVAGGANFPDAPPWEGGAKAWRDDIHVLTRAGDGSFRWHSQAFRLPRRLAYGASISTINGLVCIGGCDAEKSFAEVWRIRWSPKERVIEIDSLPPLPLPLADMAAAAIGETVYVAGGRETVTDAVATDHFWSLDLSQEGLGDSFAWRELPPWPGPARVLPVLAAQSDGQNTCMFLVSGRDTSPGRPTVPLTDGYKYDPVANRWSRIADIAPLGESPRCVMGAAGIGWGAYHVLVFGGDDGRLLLERERLADQIADAGEASERAEWDEELRESLTAHPGFSPDVLAYHTVTDTWVTVGQFPNNASTVTTNAVRWGDAVVIPSGEIRPGVRTPKVLAATFGNPVRFGVVNYGVLCVYLIALVGMGLYFARRENSTDDFFKAGGRIPWWAAGISIFGTTLSAITYMSLPAKAFATDWRYLMINVAILIVAPVIAIYFLPFFRRLNVTTAYEYLEARFNLVVRLLASLQFILLQLGRIAIVFLLPSLALAVVTGIDVRLCILSMGLLCIFYTACGGIEAVIWTDVIQVLVLMGGAALCLAMIVWQVPGGWNAACAMAEEADKFRTFDFRLDFSSATFWVLLFGGCGDKLVSYGTDQSLIQRYLTTKDEASARQGIWLNAIIAMPSALLFFGLGTALYVFYRTNPGALSPTVTQQDAIFPWYIVTQLPAGASGILIAGLFAASMSSLDSSMNSVATAVTTDFYVRFRPGAADSSRLTMARWITVLVGGLGTGLALLMTKWDIKSLWDRMGTVLGLFGSGLAGLFLLAIFTRRTSATAALLALLGSAALQMAIVGNYSYHPWTLSITGIVSSVLLGIALSVAFPNRKPHAGLTIHSLRESP